MTFTETYRSAEISYAEETNDWRIRLAGNSLNARKSLKLARKAVDDTFKAEMEFTRHTAFMVDSCGVHLVTVTSYCDADENPGTYRGGDSEQQVWIVKANGDREKTSIQRLREPTDENAALVKQMEDMRKQEHDLSSKRYALLKTLSEYKLRPPVKKI